MLSGKSSQHYKVMGEKGSCVTLGLVICIIVYALLGFTFVVVPVAVIILLILGAILLVLRLIIWLFEKVIVKKETVRK